MDLKREVDQPQPTVGEDSAPPMTIEQLAQRTAMTVRNLRELQTRGLLEPPKLAGRKGFYGEHHVARVALVKRLQERGYSLVSIADLLASWTVGGGVLATLEDAVVTPAAGVQAPLSRDELVRWLPELLADEDLLQRARAVDFVRGEGSTLHAASAELVHIARAFIDGGVPLSALLVELASLRADAARIAGRFRDMFQRHVIDDLQRQDMPAEKMGDLAARIAQLRPLGVRATAIVLGLVIEQGSSPRAGGVEAPRSAAKEKARKRAAPVAKARRPRE